MVLKHVAVSAVASDFGHGGGSGGLGRKLQRRWSRVRYDPTDGGGGQLGGGAIKDDLPGDFGEALSNA